MPNPVVGWQIDAADPERVVRFYTGLFGWTSGGAEHVQPLESNSSEGINGGIHGTHDSGGRGMLTVHIRVDDVGAYLDKAVQFGGKVVADVHVDGQGLTLARFADPEGNVIVIMSER